MISQSKKFAPTVKFLTQSKVILIINLNEGNESNLLVNLFLKLSFYIDIKKIVENNHRDPFFFKYETTVAVPLSTPAYQIVSVNTHAENGRRMKGTYVAYFVGGFLIL